jgi:hypothetical protein
MIVRSRAVVRKERLWKRRVATATNCPHHGRNIYKDFRVKPDKWWKVPKLSDPRGFYNLQKVNDNVILVCFLCLSICLSLHLHQVGNLGSRCQYMIFIVVEPFFFINQIMYFQKFPCLFIFAKYTLTLKHLSLPRNLKADHP